MSLVNRLLVHRSPLTVFSRPLKPALGSRKVNTAALDDWIASPKNLTTRTTLHPETAHDLYVTLPTRDGSRTQSTPEPPKEGTPLGYGDHLAAYFHSRFPESQLRSDATDPDICPPEPFTRRMWAGGRISWNPDKPLLLGDKVVARSDIVSIEKKGFDSGGVPMVFVKQKIEYQKEGEHKTSINEERTHVYMPNTARGQSRPVRKVTDVPSKADYKFTYVPSLTTLFRFSALMFNAHHIHLDKDYALKEGYPERLVHGPLTALMLLEVVQQHRLNTTISSFEYRARNPIIVNRPANLFVAWEPDSESGLRVKKTANVWCADDDGVVGMTGVVQCL